MKKIIAEKHYKLFLIIVLSILFVAIFACIFLLNVFFERTYKEKLNEQTATKTRLATATIKQMDSIAKTTLLSIDLNPKVMDLFSYGGSSPEQVMRDLNEIACTYIIAGEANPHAYMYLLDYANDVLYSLNTSQKIYTLSEFKSNPILKTLSSASSKSKFDMTLFSSAIATDYIESELFTYYYFEGDSVSYSERAIVICFTSEWLKMKLTEIATKDDEFIVLDKDGAVITRTYNFPYDITDYQNVILNKNDKTSKIEKNSFFIQDFTVNGLKISLFTDNSVLNNPLNQMRTTLIIIFFLLAACIICCIPLSFKTYKVFKKKIQDSAPQKLTFTQMFLKINNSSFEDADYKNYIDEFCSRFNIIKNDNCCVLYFNIDSRINFFLKYSSCELPMIKSAFCDLINNEFKGFFIESFEMSKRAAVSVVANLNKEKMDSLLSHVKNIQMLTEEKLGFTVSVAISNLTPFENLKNAYTDAKLLSEYLFSVPDLSVLCPDFTENEDALSMTPNFLNECFMLITGLKIKELKDYLQENVFNFINGNPPLETTHCLTSVTNILREGLYTLSKKYDIKLSTPLSKLQTLYAESWKITEFASSLNEILDNCAELLQPAFSGGVSDKKNKLTETVCKMVEQQYSDFNLSVTSLADSLSLSSVYLCKIFKASKDIQLNNYINEYRISKAAEMLENKNLSIKDVSIKCGFMNTNYFYTLFKKYKKVTAADYKSRYESASN